MRLSNGQPGWVLTTGVYSGVPDEVKQYAERRRIISYVSLGEVEDRSGNPKKTWLWTQVGRSKQQHDFDLYRVFMVEPKARRLPDNPNRARPQRVSAGRIPSETRDQTRHRPGFLDHSR